MLLNISNLFVEFWNFIASIDLFNRSILSFLTSFLMMLILGNKFIKLIKKTKKFIQPIRDDGPQSHLSKIGTPSLGGLLIMLCFIISSLIFVKTIDNLIMVIILGSSSFAFIGLIDDLLKLIFKNVAGLKGKLRLFLEFIIAFFVIKYLLQIYPPEISQSILFPFFQSFFIPLGIVGIFIFGSFVLVGTANSVNLTDGLDGLASWVCSGILIILLALIFIIISPGIYIKFSYSSLFYYNQIRELEVIVSALLGALLGFLWFNSYPAKIFMGDVGSLGVGSAIGIIVIAIKQEFFLAVVGIILIVESLSVIIQVYYYKFTKKRIFLMAPIHHHFEKKGYKETTIVSRIFLITIVFGALALLFIDL